MVYEKEAYLYQLFHYIEKIQEGIPKIQMLLIRLAQMSHFGLWDVILHPESKQAFHAYYVKWGYTLTCKMISWD